MTRNPPEYYTRKKEYKEYYKKIYAYASVQPGIDVPDLSLLQLYLNGNNIETKLLILSLKDMPLNHMPLYINSDDAFRRLVSRMRLESGE